MEALKKHRKYVINMLSILILVILILGVSFYSTMTIIKNQSRTIGMDSVRNISYNSQNILNSAEEMLNISCFSLSGMNLQNMSTDYINGYIQEFSQYVRETTNHQCNGIYCYLNTSFFSGNENYLPDENCDIKSLAWYSEAVKAGGSNVFIVSDDKSTISISRYIANCGVAAIDIDANIISSFMDIYTPDDSMWNISDSSGNIILSSYKNNFEVSPISEYSSDEGMMNFTDEYNERHIAFYHKLNDAWYVNVIISENELYSESYILLQRQMIFSIVFCIIIFILYTNSYINNIHAENASEVKSRFLANISHEIRTPMNGIVGLTEIARNNMDSPEQITYCINKIAATTEFLKMLIDDILDAAKIESGKMKINNQPFSLEQLVKSMEELFRPQIEAKGIEFIVKRNYDDISLSGDIMRIKQIIVNLIGNAMKFTVEGRIEFVISYEKISEYYGRVRFSVNDTGIGIKKENLDKIFKPFEQAENNISHQFGGTGLGLAISSNLVKLMGGNLEVESETGKGSKFSFAIDMKISETKKISVAQNITHIEKYNFKNKKVLLAEDNELNAEIAEALLKKAGFSVDIAHNGKEAVYMFETSGIRCYDIILMDIRMPEMDGMEASRQIRSLSRSDAQSVIIIAMTANVFDDDRQKALNAGMNEYLAKPINIKLLYKTINKLFE
ncbi:MAG: ATP-binding protein [Oscillospiraceae bacterium]